MKKLRALPESSFLKLFFCFFTLCLFVAAAAMPDRAEMFKGMWQMAMSPSKLSTNAFSFGYAAAFLNAGLVCLLACLLFQLPKAKANAASMLAFLLTAGFTFWGINVVNVWFGLIGVFVYCAVKRQAPGTQVNAMLFTTGLAPLFSDLLLRYPNAEVIGFHRAGLALALGAGLIVGFFLPAGLAFSSKVHQGYSLYSAAVPIGLGAFLLRGILYQVLRVDVPAAASSELYAVASWPAANVFCFAVFGLCIVFALLLGCKPRDYWQLLKDSGYKVDFAAKYGNAAALMNVGIYGLVIVAYYNVIGATFNAITLGCVFCMLSCCCSGSHPRNVLPILLGYVAVSFLMKWLCIGDVYAQTIAAQSIIVGACFANGLSPVSGRYGCICGIAAGMLHFCLVTSVPNLHGGFCLYNGGFTAAFVAMILVPVLQHFFRAKDEKIAVEQKTA